MNANNKRKSTATSAVEDEEESSKRRRSTIQNAMAMPTPTQDMELSSPQPLYRRIARPKRWRTSRNQATPTAWAQTNSFESPVQSRHGPTAMPVQEVESSSRPTESTNVALRFSFAGSPEETEPNHQQDQTLNRSFSELLVNEKKPTRFATRYRSFVESSAQATVPPSTTLPNLSKPQTKKKKREGYGFSYSETFCYDSFEYPDTECGLEDETGQGQEASSSKANNGQKENSQAQTLGASFGGSTVIDGDFPVEDYVVIRDVGSFHIAKPQKLLPCTKATREDTIRLKAQAKALLDMYPESSEIQGQLLMRLERMACVEKQKEPRAGAASVTNCALKLRDFLLNIIEERVATGEHRRFVEHELEWAKWLVEASWTGVMHLKTGGCTCRPDWEED